MKARQAYASFLELGSRIGLILAVAAFILYVSGILPSSVKISEMDRYWSLPLADYVAATGIPTGPGAWLSMLGMGDGLAALPVVFLSLLSLVAYVMIALPTIRDRDHTYAVFIIAEAALIGATVLGFVGG
jgi:hypothetical protein